MWGIPLKPVETLLHSCARAMRSSQLTLGGLVIVVVAVVVVVLMLFLFLLFKTLVVD